MDLGRLRELSEHRTCIMCGEEFKTDKKEGGLSAMQKQVDHLGEHQPTMAQWTEAYSLIRKTSKRRE